MGIFDNLKKKENENIDGEFDMGDLDTLIKQLQKIEGIQSVVRTDL